YKLSSKEHEATKYLTWISTHPDSKERAEYIIAYSKDKLTDYKPILSNEMWEKLKEELKD
ncbi:MAG: peptidase M48, partial [Bacteroidia bacterium]